MSRMDSLPQYSNLGYIHLVGRSMLSLSQVLFQHPCFAIESDIYHIIKPINNRWAWGMVPEEGGATRQAELITQVSMTTCERKPPGWFLFMLMQSTDIGCKGNIFLTKMVGSHIIIVPKLQDKSGLKQMMEKMAEKL